MPSRGASPSSPFALLVHVGEEHRHAYAEDLRRAGFAVCHGASGVQAIESATALLPDVIILDLELDDFDGWQVCRLLKSGKDTREIPLVVLVPGCVEDGLRRARDAGCDAALPKLVTPEALVAATQLLLGHRGPLHAVGAAGSAFLFH